MHRIGRSGRAGVNGLAITLAERMDTGLVRRIQAFTTQQIPVGRIAGLEPKMPPMGPERKPAFGKRPAPGQRRRY